MMPYMPHSSFSIIFCAHQNHHFVIISHLEIILPLVCLKPLPLDNLFQSIRKEKNLGENPDKATELLVQPVAVPVTKEHYFT
ncbi:hypothetical protein TURU_127353 [Turdus rufiventris]|nr:hypothetical protein TURU_127353 [Turdus rufiventris]